MLAVVTLLISTTEVSSSYLLYLLNYKCCEGGTVSFLSVYHFRRLHLKLSDSTVNVAIATDCHTILSRTLCYMAAKIKKKAKLSATQSQYILIHILNMSQYNCTNTHT